MTLSMPTVLIVEDEPLVREVAVAEFMDAGFVVIEAIDGASALAHLGADAAIDVLFTDIRLPGTLDGWAIARHARSVHPALPVIYATGFSGDGVAVVEGGHFVSKPYRPTAIVAAARALIADATGGG